jgi:AcrR family transcriptional regulator
MSTKGQTTRSRLLAVGLDTISVEGLTGLTLGGLAVEAGVSKSGLFAHFKSKEDLQLSILDEAVRLAGAHVVAPAMNVEPGLPRLRAIVENWLGWSTRSGLRGGCPMAAAIFELDDLSGEVRDRIVEQEAAWRGFLTALVREAVSCGHLPKTVDVDQFVWELFGIYLSHHASSRFLRDPQARDRAGRAFAALLRRAGKRDAQ